MKAKNKCTFRKKGENCNDFALRSKPKKTDWLIFYQLSKMSNVWNDVNFPYIKQFSEIQNLCKKARS